MASDRKTRILLALIPVVGAVIAAYWQFVYKPAHSDTKASYQGRVIDKESRQVIEGAMVSVETTGVPPNTHTDSNGVFRLELSGAPESVRVRVMATGYQPFDEFVPLSEGKFEDIRLTPNGQAPSQTPGAAPSSPADKGADNSTKTNRSAMRGPRAGTADLANRRKKANEALEYTSPTPRP